MRSTKNHRSSSPVRSTADLAKLLGLSRWTVSRVLNGHEGVHPDTAARIQYAMKEHGFSPNLLAQGLKTGRTNIVGICIPDIEGYFLGPKLEFLRKALIASGFQMMVAITNGNAQEELSSLRHFQELRAAGVILMASQIPRDSVPFRHLLSNQTPVILIDPTREPSSDSIYIDRAQGMKEAVRHLFTLGHQHIATLSFPADSYYANQRKLGIMAAFKEASLSPKKYLHAVSPASTEGSLYKIGTDMAVYVRDLAHGKIQNMPRITAVLAYNDRIAIGLIQRLKEIGVHIPGDLSVIGYDNMEVSGYTSPKLTTIDARPDELMQKVAERFLEAIQGRKTPGAKPLGIPARLLCRETTGAPG